MEVSSSPPLTDLDKDSFFSYNSQEVEGLQYTEEEKGDECDYLVFEMGEKERGEQQGGSEDGEGEEDCGRRETQGEDERRGVVEGEEDGRGETEGAEEQREIEIEVEEKGKVGESEAEDEERTRRDDDGKEGMKEVDEWITGMLGEMKEDLCSITENPSCPSSVIPSGPPETTSQEAWGHNLSLGDDLSDSLQAELAVVCSDSDEGEDQWGASPPYDVTRQVEGGGAILDVNESRKANREEGEEEEEARTGAEEVVEEQERMGGRANDEEEMKARGDMSPSLSSTASLTDLDRMVPPDFCVKQENLSENVSTEHVDFMLARQQWRKMEEEVKGQPTPKPGLAVQGSFQGTHTSLYPPTRSPRLKHREIQPSTSKEAPPSSLSYASDEDSSWNDLSFRSPLEELESAVEREIRLTLEREEQHRRERGMILQGMTLPRPSTLSTAQSPPRPPACRTPTLSISPSSSSLPRSMYHEMTANNVIILEPDSSSSASRNRLLSSGIGGRGNLPASLDVMSSGNVIVVETSNLIIRSTSEFCLSSAPVSMETQESTFTSNPFFKLRSISSQSLVEQEIKMVRHREEEWRRQREEMWRRKREEEWRRGRERYDTVLVSPGLHENITFNVPEVPDRSVSSPSSPSRSRKMERSSLSCDHKFPPSLSAGPRRQNAMAQRWEASLLANQKKE
ncbi:cilia- and flagella-associated protein 251-like isoform X2 [Melanotaenia boesemani]|nr:cilia- and flagella-associated protein 251-like isoform X2 [Melanotaenia boesemani]XP_041849320.1 cilia- and flagella-associated protein 251-like isoform X2 [Melanotaenia boesemani]